MMAFEKELSSLEAGSHLCAVTVTRNERHEILAAFLHDGLRRGECCALVASVEHQNAVCGLLGQAGVSTSALREREALVLRDSREVYAPEGRFDPTQTLERARLAIEKARALGFHGYRVAGVPGSLLHDLEGSSAAFSHHEADITELMRATHSLALCMFDRRRLGPSLLGVTLQTHPLALLGGRLCDNPFCDPPAYSRGVVGDAKKLSWMINQILHSEDSIRALRSMNEALIHEAASLSARTEQQRLRSEKLQLALDARDAILALATRWFVHTLPHFSAQLESVLQDKRTSFARGGFEKDGKVLASLQRLARGLQDIDAVLNPTASSGPEETNLVQIVSEAMANLPGLANCARAEVRLVAPGQLVGWWDPARLRQVVCALVEVSGERSLGSTVDFCLEDLGSTARLTVQFHAFSEPCPRELDSGGSAVLSAQRWSEDQLALALWPPRETIRQMGGSFDLTTSADSRMRITIELPRSATGLAGSAALLH